MSPSCTQRRCRKLKRGVEDPTGIESYGQDRQVRYLQLVNYPLNLMLVRGMCCIYEGSIDWFAPAWMLLTSTLGSETWWWYSLTHVDLYILACSNKQFLN